MTMPPGLRKLVLTVHITSSVGWLGAVSGFLVLAVVGVTSHDAGLVRAAYVVMDVLGWLVIVPLGVGSLLVGVLQSLGTKWGLFRHYWVLIKFLMTTLAVVILLVHMQPVGQLARAAAETTLSSTDLRGMRMQLIADAGAALLVLLVATTLGVYKPRGITPYGLRKPRESQP
jgi:hypothetical protein